MPQQQDRQRLKDLFSLALERPRDRRPDFLREACAGDDALRGELESLLAAHDDPRPVIERDDFAAASLFGVSGAGYEGRQFGHYRTVREIGRGGMGVVYLAERADGEFEQRAALKILRHNLADTELARRFRQERQILASLNHPNIARLLDGGVSADGEPYLAMEHVEGDRIDDYCDAKNLSAARRLRLFIEVCRGVAYAHQHLVVHRDLKPSNILVTPEGVPKLLDFGIAKLLDPARAGEQTRTELRAFTPDYASPEQVGGGQITTASDVYSLGVLLGDLLRGASLPRDARNAPGRWRSETPGLKTAAADLAADGRVEEGEARTKRGRIAGELENIVAMARHEDPARRYASAAQLAEDVQRYLDGLPVRAQKDSFTYRAGKFARRNKVGVAAAALVLLSLVLGVAATLWQSRRTAEQARIAAQERDRAERRFNDVRQLSNALLTDIAPKIERLPGATEARQSVVAQSLKYLDSLAGESADDAALQSELASAYEKVGELQGNPTNPNLAALSEALDSYMKANRIRRALIGQNPRDFEQRLLLADNLRALGDIRWQTNEPEESMNNSRAALDIYTELQAERPDSPGLRLMLARVNADIGKCLATNERFADSIPYFEKTISLAEGLRHESPGDTDVLLTLAEGHKQLGNSLAWERRQAEAESEAAKSVAINESLVAAHPDDVRFRTALHQTYMMTSSDYEDVNDALSNEYAFKALKVIEETVARDPANLRARQQLAKTYSRLGVTLNNTGKGSEAIAHLERAVAVLGEIARGESKNRRFRHDLATAHIRLGDARHKLRHHARALAEYERAAAILSELAENDPADNASQRNLANVSDSVAKAHEGLAAQSAGAAKQAHAQSALRSYRRALDILSRLEARGALSKLDGKLLARVRSAVAKYEKE